MKNLDLQVYINWLDSHFAKVEVESSSLFTCSEYIESNGLLTTADCKSAVYKYVVLVSH